MMPSSSQNRRHKALALTGCILLALMVLIAAAAQAAVSWPSTSMAQEPAGVVERTPVEELDPTPDPPPDFELSVDPAEQRIIRTLTAESYTRTVTVTASAGFESEVSLKMEEPLPTGVEASLDPESLQPSSGETLTATLTLTTGIATPSGMHELTVIGSGGKLVHTASLTLTVHEGTFLPLVVCEYDYVCSLHEPNDDRSTALPAEPGGEYRSYICPGDPGDYYTITLESPVTLILSLTNLTNLPPDADYDLWLADSSDWIAWSYEYGQVDEYIEYEITEAGVYYIYVYPFEGSSREVPYVLTVETDP